MLSAGPSSALPTLHAHDGPRKDGSHLVAPPHTPANSAGLGGAGVPCKYQAVEGESQLHDLGVSAVQPPGTEGGFSAKNLGTSAVPEPLLGLASHWPGTWGPEASTHHLTEVGPMLLELEEPGLGTGSKEKKC